MNVAEVYLNASKTATIAPVVILVHVGSDILSTEMALLVTVRYFHLSTHFFVVIFWNKLSKREIFIITLQKFFQKTL